MQQGTQLPSSLLPFSKKMQVSAKCPAHNSSALAGLSRELHLTSLPLGSINDNKVFHNTEDASGYIFFFDNLGVDVKCRRIYRAAQHYALAFGCFTLTKCACSLLWLSLTTLPLAHIHI